MRLHKTIKAVALFEAFKGFLAVAAASGLLLLFHRDVHELAVRLIEHAHLNPAAKYPSIFIAAATHLGNPKLVTLALGAAAYSLARFIEAYGLFHEATWAEMFAAISAAVYIPFEIAELVRRTDGISIGALALNVAVVLIMMHALRQKRR